MAKSADFSGTGVALVTPFDNKGSIDYKELEALVERMIKQGIDYLVVLGTTAETPTLSKEEKISVIDAIKKHNAGRLPIVVGAGGNNTAEVIQWIEEIGSEGIDAYLSVAPYYNKPGQLGMKQHFAAIAASSELPIILYNVPGRTGSSISADLVLELANEFKDKIVAIKEASGDFAHIMRLINERPSGFLVLSGDDAITLPMIASGADGVISVIANSHPQEFSDMVRDARAGKFDDAREKHYKLLALITAIFEEGNPTGVKALMDLMGNGDANLRLPLIPASERLVKKLGSLI